MHLSVFKVTAFVDDGNSQVLGQAQEKKKALEFFTLKSLNFGFVQT